MIVVAKAEALPCLTISLHPRRDLDMPNFPFLLFFFAYPHPQLSKELFDIEENCDGLSLELPSLFIKKAAERFHITSPPVEYVDTMPYPEYKAHATNTYNHALATVLNLMQSVPGNLETEDELRDWLRYPELAAPQYTSETIRAAIQYALVEYLPAPVKETPPPQRVPLKAPA